METGKQAEEKPGKQGRRETEAGREAQHKPGHNLVEVLQTVICIFAQ